MADLPVTSVVGTSLWTLLISRFVPVRIESEQLIVFVVLRAVNHVLSERVRWLLRDMKFQ